MSRWRLEFETGGSFTLPTSATLVGRSSACDVVLDAPTISRRQLLLHPRIEGVEVVNLGRQPLTCNGTTLAAGELVRDGGRLELGGSPLATIRAHETVEGSARWLLRIDEGPALRLTRTPYAIGGGTDDLFVAGWPAGALQLHDVGHRLVAVISEDARGLLRATERGQFDEGIAALELGTPLRVDGRSLSLTPSGSSSEASTLLGEDEAGRCTLQLEAYARGGLLSVSGRGPKRAVYLAARRFALIRALISPTPPARAGELRSVHQLCRAIWPDDPIKDETDFNVLLYRVRRDLVGAGLDAGEFIERVRGSGMVRSPLAARAKVIDSPSKAGTQ